MHDTLLLCCPDISAWLFCAAGLIKQVKYVYFFEIEIPCMFTRHKFFEITITVLKWKIIVFFVPDYKN